MKRVIILGVLMICLSISGCQKSSLPTQTPTVSFSNLQMLLSPILYYDGEITSTTRLNWPGGITIGRIPQEYTGFGKPIFVCGKEILNVAYNKVGYVLVIKYETDEELNNIYDSIEGNTTSLFGEIGQSKELPDHWIQAVFIRCSYLIFITSYGPLIEEVENYAYQLEGRLLPILCGE